jgi:hypothetical protein
VHFNITQHPTAAWTLQQLWEVIGCGMVIDTFSTIATASSRGIWTSTSQLGLRVLKLPPHSPKANVICERVIGTIRRECLDWMIPVSELHLRSVLKVWVTHYSRACSVPRGLGAGNRAWPPGSRPHWAD